MSKDQNPSDKACDAYFDNPYAATSGSYYSDRVTFYAGFAAGAASRDAEVYTKQGAIDMLNQWNDELLAQIKQKDAEVARLKTVPMRYRRMAFNAQLQDEVAELVAALKPFGAIDLVESRLPAEFAMLILRARAALAAAKTQGYSE